MLVWERNGFIVWYKRLERHRFHWPRVGDAVLTLSGEQLNRLLDGYDVWDEAARGAAFFGVRLSHTVRAAL